MSDSYFSTTYTEARHRFNEAATALGATVRSYKIDGESDEELAIDVAMLGGESDPAVVVSSGVHGVEGFFGSSVQLALLDNLKKAQTLGNIRYVLIHSVNPFGFSRLRRVNEDNVDLNRNFLASADGFSGAPDGYASLDAFLNPESPPSRLEPFGLKAIWYISTRGLQALKEAVARGQYEYPLGLFFGGKGPCRSTRIVQENCDSWLASSQKVFHVDFHTGLGAFGTYKLLVTESPESKGYAWFADTFGAKSVESLTQPGGTAYPIDGTYGEWMQGHFSTRDYRFVGAEFGTYGVIRVLGAIRAENRAHHFGSEIDALYRWVKGELLECFCPSARAWRRKVVDSGLVIIDQGMRALKGTHDA
jgi:hypothetical protein